MFMWKIGLRVSRDSPVSTIHLKCAVDQGSDMICYSEFAKQRNIVTVNSFKVPSGPLKFVFWD